MPLMTSSSFAGAGPQPITPLLNFVPNKRAYNGAAMVYSGKGSRLDPTWVPSRQVQPHRDIHDDQRSIISSVSSRGGSVAPYLPDSHQARAHVAQYQTNTVQPLTNQQRPGPSSSYARSVSATPHTTSSSTIYERQNQLPTGQQASFASVTAAQPLASALRKDPRKDSLPASTRSQPVRKVSFAEAEARGRVTQKSPTPSRGQSPASIRSEPSGGQKPLPKSLPASRSRANSDAASIRPARYRRASPAPLQRPSQSSIGSSSSKQHDRSSENSSTSGVSIGTGPKAAWRPVFAHPPPPPPPKDGFLSASTITESTQQVIEQDDSKSTASRPTVPTIITEQISTSPTDIRDAMSPIVEGEDEGEERGRELNSRFETMQRLEATPAVGQIASALRSPEHLSPVESDHIHRISFNSENSDFEDVRCSMISEGCVICLLIDMYGTGSEDVT